MGAMRGWSSWSPAALASSPQRFTGWADDGLVMVNLLPHLVDMPMSLGDHLEELRRRLIWPLIALAVLFIASFAYNKELKVVFLQPLSAAIDIIGPEKAKLIGLEKPKDGDLSTWRPFTAFQISDSAMASMTVSFYAAFAITIPILVYQIWRFVAVGLMPKERQLAFLFVPAGIIFFYAGTVLGYFWGLPYYFAWMLEWTAGDPTTKQIIGLSSYLDSFTMMTVCAGLVMDIPWLVMVLVRIGLVTPQQLGRWRKVVIMVNTMIASVITPPDGTSMLAMLVPLQLLFESGLLASRAMMWYNGRAEAREALAASKAQAADQEHGHGDGHDHDHDHGDGHDPKPGGDHG
jgi:sec-independent protein translocase protein TatC